MKLAVWLPSICALSLALLTIIQGCGSSSSQAPKMVATPSPDTPRPVTDLSQVAPGSALNPFGKKDEQAIARRVADDDDIVGRRVENLGAYGAVRHVGDDKHPGELRLLNKKAAEFETLSMRLMDQVFNQVEHLQEQDEISHLKLPTDLRWVIITGTLNRQGVLKELVIEQHSGTAAIDKMAIAACKKGLYIHNPPPDAADESGNYKVRIQTRLETFASLDGEHWEFRTYMGLAFL
jgi:hypothetical protein